jgi:hypothetical protein
VAQVPDGAAIERVLEQWRPRTVGPSVASFTTGVVRTAAPKSPARAKALVFATAKLAAFAESVGLELTPAVVLHPAVIERFIVTTERTLTGATRRTLRSNLRFVAARVAPGAMSSVGLARERAKPAYSAAEVEGYLARAAAQPTASRRRRATGLICLGAGAGLTGADLRAVRGDDVVACHDGVVVDVRGGAHPRHVPVRARFCDLLVESARSAGPGLVTGGVNPDRRNITDRLVASLSGGGGLPRFEVVRLRSTWLRACAESIGLRAFMDAAGVTCSQRLGDIVASLEPVDEARSVALLGGPR